MHPAVRDDRIWFQKNPAAIVRFRRAIAGEFQALIDQGAEAPVFRPSFCRSEAPTRWVAVVDLMRWSSPETWNHKNHSTLTPEDSRPSQHYSETPRRTGIETGHRCRTPGKPRGGRRCDGRLI